MATRKGTVAPTGGRATRKRAVVSRGVAERVADLAWAGQQEQAIATATAALDDTTLPPAARLALLDLRAESLLAIGDFGAALDDAEAMQRVAAGKRELRIGIGIASGDMVEGYAGTNERATYTCSGDTVNLASRLEAHTKVAQRAILTDGATRAGLGDRFAIETLGVVPIRGKSAAVDVFAVSATPKR